MIGEGWRSIRAITMRVLSLCFCQYHGFDEKMCTLARALAKLCKIYDVNIENLASVTQASTASYFDVLRIYICFVLG